LTRSREREAIFDRDFLADLAFWVETDRKVALRLLELVEAARRDPFQGIGKPEPLKNSLAGTWSRRINLKHRMVYRVTETHIEFLQARYHY
jgi:toxin YoeB